MINVLILLPRAMRIPTVAIEVNDGFSTFIGEVVAGVVWGFVELDRHIRLDYC